MRGNSSAIVVKPFLVKDTFAPKSVSLARPQVLTKTPKAGRSWVAAGKLLNDIIRAMRMTREEVYILNSLKCRPPQNRTPLPEEVNNCRPFALTQLELLQPEFIVLLGAVAVRSVLQTDESVGRLRGRFHHFHGARVVVTYHPAYLLRTPEAKKLVWSDVQMVMRELKLI